MIRAILVRMQEVRREPVHEKRFLHARAFHERHT